MSKFDFDLFTIGGGSGGVRASRFATNMGARVAVAEGAQFGGTCVNVGCIPKKLMSIAAHYRDDYADAVGFGWNRTQPTFDWAKLLAHKDHEIGRLNSVYASGLRGAGATIVEGWAQVLDAHSVLVNGKTYTAEYILLATGGKPMHPQVAGAQLAITSDDFFHLDSQPRRVLVYGGGYIAVELASILHGLGTQTTLAYRGSRLLKGFDADLGSHLAQQMVARGLALKLSTTVRSIESRAEARLVRFAEGTTLEVDQVIFATGRAPNTQGLGLVEAGVTLAENGAVVVDEQLRSSVPSIFAVGDVVNRLALTPVATSEGMMVAEYLFGNPGRTINYALVPTAVFSHPCVASVGLSEEQARAKGHGLRIFRSSFTPLRHTLSGRSERALIKLVVDAKTDRVLGAHLVGPEAGEIIQGFAVALTCGATKAQFDATLGVHPTMAEEFVTLREPVTA
jgi:glutathione reductase (NADPH)